MKLLILASCLTLISCSEKKRVESAVIVIPLQCVTSDIKLENCDSLGLNCKRVRFSHRIGCEELKAK
jgi:hypothetical protein